MQTKQLSFFLSLLLTLCLFHDTQAQQAGRIESMKLLTAEAGWASTRTNLFWTTDDGQHWKDITPKPAATGEAISATFFLDSSSGWVLFASSSTGEGQPRFDIASTTDAGNRWTLSRVNVSGLNPPEAMLSGASYMYFLDSSHGWINLSVASGSAFHPGATLSTQDGGKNWTWVPMGSGSAGPIMFTTPKDGWILSPDHAELDVTHDGSKSWRELSLQAPPLARAGSGDAISYDLPTFQDGSRGFLTAGFAGSDGMTLFSTADGGFTWKADRVLPHTEESETVISHSRWMAASIPLHSNSLALTTITLANNTSEPTALKADVSHIRAERTLWAVTPITLASRTTPTAGF
jgi:photosystem II stability/assembly factor-like uncharacterized protein